MDPEPQVKGLIIKLLEEIVGGYFQEVEVAKTFLDWTQSALTIKEKSTKLDYN